MALAKRCRKLGVPVPGRGYWSRVAAGQTPHRPTLRKRADKPADYDALTFSAPREDSPAPPEPHETAALREKLETLEFAGSDDLRSASSPVRRTAIALKRPWRKEIHWQRGERKGSVVAIDVNEDSADRALLVAERLLATAESIGWAFEAASNQHDERIQRYDPVRRGPPPPPGCLRVEGESFALRIDERNRRIDHVLTEREKAAKRRGESVWHPRWDYVPTGELRLSVSRAERDYTLRTWKDSKRVPLEDKIRTILSGLLDEALKIKADRERRRLAEIERQRQEELRWAQSQRRAANARLVHELEAQAGAWLRAKFLRRYLKALRRTLGDEQLQAKRGEEKIDFLKWAERYIDQLDPLTSTPHDPDLMDDHPSYLSPAQTEVTETLSRLLGRHWADAFKVKGTSSEDEGR